MDEFVLHCVVAQQHNDDECIGVHIYKIETLYCNSSACCQCDRRIIRELRSELAYVTDGVIELMHPVVQTGVYLLRLLK